MNLKSQYEQYVWDGNLTGSRKAPSYIQALDFLDRILKRTQLFERHDFWSIDSVEDVEKLYEYALRFQTKEGGEFLQPDLSPSYGRNRYYSAALKNYKKFLLLYHHETHLWDLVEQTNITPSELLKRLNEERISSIENWVPEQNIDFSTKEGKEKLCEVKTRVNQGFFRRLVLSTYQAQCCVTGLNLPEVLRASHIVAWADDKKNRLNPANGLCLSATYDAAFDRHLISFDENYRMILSPALKDYYSNEAFKTQFMAFEGKQISIPKRFCPDQEFLKKHREKI